MNLVTATTTLIYEILILNIYALDGRQGIYCIEEKLFDKHFQTIETNGGWWLITLLSAMVWIICGMYLKTGGIELQNIKF